MPINPVDAAEIVRQARYELALAIANAAPARDSPVYYHIVWHNFQPWFGVGEPHVWGMEIRNILHPALMQDPQWVPVAELLVPLVKWLLILDTNFYVGCARCS